MLRLSRIELKLRVPLKLLRSAAGQAVFFQLAVLENDVPLETIPPESWIELTNWDV